MSDAENAILVDAWRGGDQEAGRALFERYYEPVARFFVSKVGDDSGDLIQKTFLACLAGRERMRDGAIFRAYLFTVAHNLLYKHYHEQRRDGTRLDFEHVCAESLSPSPSPSAALTHKRELRLVLEGLRRIPLDYQVLLELHYWEHMSVAEIAEVLALPLGTAKTRLRRGRQLLGERMADIAGSNVLLRETLEDLDGWAGRLRAHILPGSGESPAS
jgi:RNA polymerase sigma-70 factor (ECF subfamily)